MKILHVNNNDLIGGAAVAANRIVEGQKREGLDCPYYVRVKTKENLHVFQPSGMIERAESIISSRLDKQKYKNRTGNSSWTNWSAGLYGIGLNNIIKRFNPDIINLHWINAGFIDIKSIGSSTVPIVWTIHDCWPFTGGCHYFNECNGYETGCRNCPGVRERYKKIPENIIKRKQKFWEDKNITIVSPSRWLAEKAEESLVLHKKQITVIPNCIDSEVFYSIDKKTARKNLGLPQENYKLLLFIGSLDSETVKGGHLLTKALKKLTYNEQIFLLNPGNKDNKEINGIKIIPFNSVPADKMNLVFSASDLLVLPSVQENLANTIMESLFCETPVAAFNIGGNPDMIEHKQNGYLVEPFDIEKLANGINWLLTENVIDCTQIRVIAKQRFGSEFIAKKYIELYKAII